MLILKNKNKNVCLLEIGLIPGIWFQFLSWLLFGTPSSEGLKNKFPISKNMMKFIRELIVKSLNEAYWCTDYSVNNYCFFSSIYRFERKPQLVHQDYTLEQSNNLIKCNFLKKYWKNAEKGKFFGPLWAVHHCSLFIVYIYIFYIY